METCVLWEWQKRYNILHKIHEGTVIRLFEIVVVCNGNWNVSAVGAKKIRHASLEWVQLVRRLFGYSQPFLLISNESGTK